MPNKFHDAMNSLAADIANEPSWRIYADWCKARANGLRDQSAVAAEQFVEVAQGCLLRSESGLASGSWTAADGS